MYYKLLKRWSVEDEDGLDTGWETLGCFRKIRKARKAMHKDVKEVEAINCYQSPDYGGMNDGQESRKLGKNGHVYIISHAEMELIEWEIVKGGRMFSKPIYECI